MVKQLSTVIEVGGKGISIKYNFEEPSQNFEIFLKLKETGFDAIDFDMCNTETDFYKLEDEKLKELESVYKGVDGADAKAEWIESETTASF